MTTLQLIKAALAEDIGKGDITSQLLIPARQQAVGHIRARAPGVLAGIRVCEQVFRTVDPRTRFWARLQDGSRFRKGTVLAVVAGRARSLLAAERTALNFLQHLSGIATLTWKFVRAIRGTRAVLLDTRKTTPGLRRLEKYAVRCGGGKNHRQGLYDQILIKDNHIVAAGSLAEALHRVAGRPFEVEVRNLAELRTALAAGARRIMLDNMSLAQMRRAVELVSGRAELEASGGINLKRVRAVALTGVDYISVGTITHSAPAVDIAFDLVRKRRP
ncbi:MAG: carboxylating nicotinate-nucleotide diphosphorylase [candidate division WOR-3 bacterium]